MPPPKKKTSGTTKAKVTSSAQPKEAKPKDLNAKKNPKSGVRDLLIFNAR